VAGIESNKEQALFDEAKGLFGELFNDLNRKNLLRKTIIPMDLDKLKKIWTNTIRYGESFNEISRKFKSFQSQETIEDFARKIGISAQSLTYLFLSQTLSLMLIYYESLLKTSLLFFLEEEQGISRKLTLGQLLCQIEIISPSIGRRLRKMIDSKLRNVIAHGDFWFEKDGLHYASDSYLQETKLITIKQLRSEVGRVGILALALAKTLSGRSKKMLL
jgi:hypothetical protein